MKKNTLDHLIEEFECNKISIQSPTKIEVKLNIRVFRKLRTELRINSY